MGDITRNKGIHPDRPEFSIKDNIVIDWIEDAYSTTFALDHDTRMKSEYQHIRESI